MRRTAAPIITAQMYRHFATATLAITGLVAFFANGEKHQAIAAEAAASRPHEHARATPPEFEQPSPAADEPGGWGSDDGDFGQPMIHPVSSGTWLAHPAHSHRKGEDDPASAQDEPASPQPSAAQIAALAAASRMRSGSGGRD